jgi:hypothetical protein
VASTAYDRLALFEGETGSKSAPMRRRKRKASTPEYLCYVVRTRVGGHCLLGIENFDHFLIEAYEQCGNQLRQLETEKRAGK